MKKENGISLVIPLKTLHGLAQNGKSFLSKLSLTNFDFDLYDDTLIPTYPDEDFQKITTNKSMFKKRLLFNTCKTNLPSGFYNMKIVFWEFESGMTEWRPTIFSKVDEVITFTDFVFNYVSKIAPAKIKITKMKYPFVKNWEISMSKDEVLQKYKINSNDFTCFFNFDYRSSFKRKNPEMVLEAFAKSIGIKNDTKLVIKTIHSEEYPDQKEFLYKLVKELGINKKVVFINDAISKNEMISLINASNCYISLHRGEGLGLGMIEAMSLGKPVIATNYSGNTEFMNKDNSLLVDYKLVDANDNYKAYEYVQKWAEPNEETAEKYLWDLYNNPEYAKEIGNKAKDFIEKYYDLEHFKLDIENVFKIKERDVKANCLLQKKKKIYFIPLFFDTFFKNPYKILVYAAKCLKRKLFNA